MCGMTNAKAGVTETLRGVPIFSGLSDTEMKFLAERAVPRQYGPGELLFSEGDACAGLYIVESGQVRIFKSSAGGREQVLAVDGPGSSIAELPVFDGDNYPASAMAVNQTAVLFVSKQDFHSMCLIHTQVALKVLRVVGKRLRTLVGIIEELSFTTVRSRLISLLLRQAGAGDASSDRAELELASSNQELAARIGTVRELVSRNLSRLQAEGLIRTEGRLVTIPSLRALRAQIEDQE
jgi:CRP/FNR family transcriptional regulator, cyclic AMP receptor protein